LIEINVAAGWPRHEISMISTITIASVALAVLLGVAVTAIARQAARSQPRLVPVRVRSNRRRS
jgi:hypothetical protein